MHIINQEPDLENNLDLLTAIGITATSEDVFRSCEHIRNEICPETIQESREELLRGSNVIGIEDNTNEERIDEVDGE
jgi:hypothetical protein